MNSWIDARETRRRQSLMAPAAALVIGVVTLASTSSAASVGIVLGSLLAAVVAVMVVSYVLRRRGGSGFPALVPSSVVTGGSDTTTRLGRLSTRPGALLWTPRPISVRSSDISPTASARWDLRAGALVWTAADLQGWRVRRVWGVVPNYYLVLSARDGSETALFTHYVPEIVRVAPDVLSPEKRSA